MTSHPEVSRFSDCPFSDSVHHDLAAAGYETPTPVQARCLLPGLDGKDIIGLAQTGTGKTAAFALPIIHRLTGRMELGALVLAPTRELVQQIVAMFNMLGRSSGTRVAAIVGGIKIEKDWKALRSWPNVVVATPGRLLDHLEQGTISLKEVEVLVVDEADRMHDMGFIPQIRRIIAALPTDRQTMMFTATMPADVEQIARRNMRNAIKILVGPASHPVERAEQTLYHLDETEKVRLLQGLLRKERGRVLVFVRTKRGVDRLARRVGNTHRQPVVRLHGDRLQNQRDDAMTGFREGRYRVLIATDIAARGLDVADIEHVINYDFPRTAEDYVHRIGRTARLAATGRATSFVTPKDRGVVRELERLVGTKVTLTPAPGSTLAMDAEPAAGGRGRGRSRGASAPVSSRAGSGTGAAKKRSRRGGSRGGRGRAPEAKTVAKATPAAGHASVPQAAQDASRGGSGGNGDRKRRRRRRSKPSSPGGPTHGAPKEAQGESRAAVAGERDSAARAGGHPKRDEEKGRPSDGASPPISEFAWQMAD